MSVNGFKAAAARFVAAAGLVCGLLGLTLPSAQAASWVDPYLDQMVSWGIMRGDINGNLEPDRTITRAEFVTMVNRAYGYTEVGPNPYQDVAATDWFYEDICIARSVGYFSGMSSTEAAPRAPLTREQAAMLIGKNMMLKSGTGETLGFNDSRQFSDWSRHMIEAVSKEGVISGYTDGSFRPQRNVTRGEVAVMLSKAIGTPIQQSGVHSLGGVYGNLTINTPGVTLKDTVVYGDLYVSGGIGLSNVELENVRVLGKIVVSGTGESEKGEHSVLLRNVTADELVLDSMANQFVTLKSEGFTNIGQVNVRTSSYLEDVTDNGYGLTGVTLDGEYGTNFQLAGNIKDVLNVTPGSTVTLAQGVTQSITIDEKAIGSQLNINNKAMAGTVNLDTAVKVEGTGDITHMNVNAAGSSSVMLPDTITVRPGITADVYEEEMDSVAAQESSAFPRLLSGYPAAENISPKATDLVFKTNKKGTIYWAVTALADGTAEEDELINPPTYGGTILKSGTITATGSNTPFTAKVSGLTTDGSYYVSAMLVDNRGMRSPVKITAFTTPDDTTPAFASGYPTVTIADGNDNEQIVQALVMPNKNCRMYYALLPKGSTAPKAADFKANAVTGNLGYGIVDVQKNTPFLVSKVNSVHLEEETEYDLYLWLTDVDGAKSSAVKKVTAKTLDRTAPHIQHLTLNDEKATSITLTFALNEPGTFYWAVVKHGDKGFCRDENGNELPIGSEQLMLKIENGLNALKKGSSSASKASTDMKFTVSGLTAQTAYDLYYMAKDKAGNYCVYRDTLKPPKVIHTLDNQPPTVTQEFSHDGSSDPSNLTPYPDSTIRLVFSENIQGVLDVNKDSKEDYTKFLELYQTGTKEDLALHLREYIKLYSKDTMEQVPERTDDGQTNWVIDYRKAKIELDNSGTGELIISFPYNEDPAKSALNLSGGATYYFVLEGIADTASKPNKMVGVRGKTNLQEFTIISAQILLTRSYEDVPEDHDGIIENGTPEEQWYFDMVFSAKPVSHKSMNDDVQWDMIVWSDSSISFKLYESKDDGKSWTAVKTASDSVANITTPDGKMFGVSVGSKLRGVDFQQLNKLETRLYAIEITETGSGETKRENFNTPITVQITMVAGDHGILEDAGSQLAQRLMYDTVVSGNPDLSDITAPLTFTLTRTFMDNTPPKFSNEQPKFTPGSSTVNMQVSMDRLNSTYYYVVAPLGTVDTQLRDTNGTFVTEANGKWDTLPESGAETLLQVQKPTNKWVMEGYASSGNIKRGKGTFTGAVEHITVEGLLPNQKYIAYFVLQGESQNSYSPYVYCFRFSTGDLPIPTIQLYDESPSVGIKTSTAADVSWFLMEINNLESLFPFNQKFYDRIGPNLFGTDAENATDTTKKAAFTTACTTNQWDANMTVLQAIETPLSSNDQRSVFDYYAGAYIYDQVYQAVVESTGFSERTDYGTKETPANSSVSERMDGMSAHPAQYYFVVGAKNKLTTGEDRYAFKAIAPIHQTDSIPPSIDQYPTTLTTASTTSTTVNPNQITGHANITDPTQNTSPLSYTYNGTVSILLSETPFRYYQGADGRTKKQQLKTEMTDEDNNTINLVDLLYVTGGTVSNATCSGNAITITFRGMSNGSTITLFEDSVIGDANGNTNDNKKLILRFYVQPLAITTPTPPTPGTSGGTGTTQSPPLTIQFDIATPEWQITTPKK